MVGHRIHPYDRDALNKEPRPRRLECAKCKFIARDPVVASCNHMFCLSCFENMHQNANAICPVDGKDVSQGSYADIAVQQEIHSLVVHCTFMDVGCIWRGQLRYLQVPCLEPEHPPDHTFLNEQMFNLAGIAEHSGVNVRTEGHDSAHEDCRPQGAGVAEAAENMQAQQPPLDVSREEFERRLEEMRAQLNYALNIEQQAREQEVVVQRNRCDRYRDEYVAELQRVCDERNVEVALLQRQLDHLKASHAALQARVRRLEGQ
ncbi:uncharacterized protein [Montipora foliosa]|uniref:uncharacterized protein isoform X2 n=1 Tax=Montipora foliosa TaxID=591990 RepID=UPI0035F1482E